MKAKIVRIGNSRGVRIPKALLEQANLGDEVELEAKDNAIVIRPARRPREGWAESCEAMAKAGDDLLPEWNVPGLSSFDEDEWTW
jgi:antitoxin MazE